MLQRKNIFSTESHGAHERRINIFIFRQSFCEYFRSSAKFSFIRCWLLSFTGEMLCHDILIIIDTQLQRRSDIVVIKISRISIASGVCEIKSKIRHCAECESCTRSMKTFLFFRIINYLRFSHFSSCHHIFSQFPHCINNTTMIVSSTLC